MRIWVDPMKLNSFQLTMTDVVSAVQAQNAQVSAGQLGNLPAPKTQELNATVSVQSRLQTPEEFGLIRLKTAEDGSVVRLRDVARIELGAENYGFSAKYNGHPATAAALRLAPGANALKTTDEVKARIAEIAKDFPADVKVIYPWDTTPFVRLSIEQVVETLIEAVVLVFLVMFLFLQNWRATLIPAIAIPVVLLGTLAIMSVAGFSINTLTLFGMVLAIGLLVDDAIVVIENVERLIQEEGLSPREAARKSMDEISGALIAIAVVLAAVFLPMAFFGGSTGVIYRQFSLTIVSAMALSVLVALILTPALAATILKPGNPLKHEGNGPLDRFFNWFNRRFERARVVHEKGVRKTIGGTKRAALAYAAIVVVMAFVFWRLPTGFLPDEDTGAVFTLVAEPSGATLPRTDRALDHVRDYFLKSESKNVEGIFTVGGFSFAGQGQNAGIAFLPLKPFDERSGTANSSKAIADRATGALSQYRDALIISFIPPPALELGNATGFDLQLVDSGNVGHAKLTEARNMLLGMAMQDKRLTGVRPVSLEDAPQLTVDVDQDKARALGTRHRPDQPDHRQRLGRVVHQRFHRPRPGQARLCPGRRILSPAARRRRRPLRPRRRRQEHGAVHRFLDPALGQRADPAVALQRPALAADPGLARARRQHRHRDEGAGGDPNQAPSRNEPAMDRPQLRGTAIERPGAGALRPVAADRIPVPRGALRKLDHPARGDPRRPAWHRRRRPGSEAHRARE